MRDTNPLLIILRTAIQFTVYVSLAIVLLSLTVGLPFGGVYVILMFTLRGFMLFLYLPVMLLIGTMIGLFRALARHILVSKKKAIPARWHFMSSLGTIVIFCVLIGWIMYPQFVFEDEIYVDHAARWYFVDPSDEELPWRDWQLQSGAPFKACETKLVLLVLEEFADTYFICDQTVVNYLETLDSIRVRVTYEVTYNFGDYRWARPHSLGYVSLEYTGWWGGENCGGRYNHLCDSPQADTRFIRQSTWFE